MWIICLSYTTSQQVSWKQMSEKGFRWIFCFIHSILLMSRQKVKFQIKRNNVNFSSMPWIHGFIFYTTEAVCVSGIFVKFAFTFHGHVLCAWREEKKTEMKKRIGLNVCHLKPPVLCSTCRGAARRSCARAREAFSWRCYKRYPKTWKTCAWHHQESHSSWLISQLKTPFTVCEMIFTPKSLSCMKK